MVHRIPQYVCQPLKLLYDPDSHPAFIAAKESVLAPLARRCCTAVSYPCRKGSFCECGFPDPCPSMSITRVEGRMPSPNLRHENRNQKSERDKPTSKMRTIISIPALPGFRSLHALHYICRPKLSILASSIPKRHVSEKRNGSSRGCSLAHVTSSSAQRNSPLQPGRMESASTHYRGHVSIEGNVPQSHYRFPKGRSGFRHKVKRPFLSMLTLSCKQALIELVRDN